MSAIRDIVALALCFLASVMLCVGVAVCWVGTRITNLAAALAETSTDMLPPE